MPRARSSWISPARKIGPQIRDLIVAQEVAPRRHLAVLAQLHRGGEAFLVVRELAQIGRDGAGIDHVGAVAMRAFLSECTLALVDLRLTGVSTLLRAGGMCRQRGCRHRDGGKMRRRPFRTSLDHTRAPIEASLQKPTTIRRSVCLPAGPRR